jgi:hypothetical protein
MILKIQRVKPRFVIDLSVKFIITSEKEFGMMIQGINNNEKEPYPMNQDGGILFLRI